MKIWRNHSQLNRILKKNAILLSNLSKRLVFDKNTNLRGSVDLLSTHSLVPTNRLKCTGRCLASKSGKMSWVSYACSCPHKLCRSCPWIVPCNVSILNRFFSRWRRWRQTPHSVLKVSLFRPFEVKIYFFEGSSNPRKYYIFRAEIFCSVFGSNEIRKKSFQN